MQGGSTGRWVPWTEPEHGSLCCQSHQWQSGSITWQCYPWLCWLFGVCQQMGGGLIPQVGLQAGDPEIPALVSHIFGITAEVSAQPHGGCAV